MDWQEVLDLDQTLVNCHVDIAGDWYRDPWGWPELDWSVKQRPDVVVARLNGTGARRTAKIDVPKENFGIRPAVVMDPIDRLIYQALTDRMSTSLARDQPDWIYGWRLPIDKKVPGEYSRNDHQWTRFVGAVKDLSGLPALLKTDIVSFFSSISIPLLCDRIVETSGDSAVTRRVSSLLTSWDSHAGRGGLPQRSAASAILANFYLAPLDDVLRHYADSPVRRWPRDKPHCVRWMDDIWLFGESASDLRVAQLDIQKHLRDISLEINLAKTDVYEGLHVIEQAEDLDHRGLDYALSLKPQSKETVSSLEQLIDSLLDQPEKASRTELKFVTTRMRKYDLYRRLPEFIDLATRMPQAADALARLFRDSGSWQDLGSWFLEYASGPWGRIDWGVAQIGTMFPSDSAPPLEVEEYFAHLIQRSESLMVTALAAQRYAAWNPDSARFLLREAVERAGHPMIRRVLALASLQAGESRTIVRRMLSEFEENRVTLDMLESRSFRKLRVTSDYLGQKRAS